MIPRLRVLWDDLLNSLWALPMAVVVVAAVVAAVVSQFHLASQGDAVWWLYSGNAGAASGFLGNMLTAMITMATLAISITMVVLTLAAQSLGPRLIPIFMSDTRTKLILGTLIGTSAYLLVVLRTLTGKPDSVPQLAVTIGTALVLLSVVLLLFFVHHLARSIVADTIIARVGETLDRHTRELMPEKPDRPDDTGSLPDAASTLSRAVESGAPLPAIRSGYLQAFDSAAIAAAAATADAVVALAHRPGQFILPGEAIAHVLPKEALDDELTDKLRDAIVQGSERTWVQDVEYSVRQLVEIAVRALSPGVNDPFTATAVIDRLAASIATMMKRAPMRAVWRDDDGAIRLAAPVSSLDGILDAAFHQIRQAGAAMPAILIRLAEALDALGTGADDEQRAAIRRHLRLVKETGARALADASDRDELMQRLAAASEKLSADR